MKFFTDNTVENDYLLIKIKDYLKMDDFSKWKEIFIDPAVYELTKSNCYSWEGEIDIHKFLDLLPKNHYFSWDYPCDMNLKFQDLFLKRSWENAQKFSYHPQYICTVQSRFRNYWNFVEWFNKYNNLKINSRILAIGNLCRFRTLNVFLKHTLDYIFSHCKYPRIHIYGLCLKAIPYAYNLSKRFRIDLSLDSTKWTKCFHTSGLSSCNKNNRQEYFEEYLTEIIKRGIKLENEIIKTIH